MPSYKLFGSYSKQWEVPIGILELKVDFQSNKSEFLLKTQGETRAIPFTDVVGITKEIFKETQILAKFLENTYARLASCSDGTYKLYINQRLPGGGNIESNPEHLWPNAHVSITVDCQSFNNKSEDIKIILDAINEWAVNTNFTFEVYLKSLSPNNISIVNTYINTQRLNIIYIEATKNGSQFVLLDNAHKLSKILDKEPLYIDYVLIQKFTDVCNINPEKDTDEDCNVCNSFVGRKGNGVQQISCKLGQSFNKGSMIHEIGHAIGLHHEQQRNDRETYVTVTADDDPVNYGKTGEEHDKYDFKSVMHYHFFDKEKMKIKPRMPVLQVQQIVELGKDQNRPLQNYSYIVDGDVTGFTHVREGVFHVGSQQNLSEGDIAAANHLASLAKNPNAFKNYAKQLSQSANSGKSYNFFVIADNVHFENTKQRDWECIYLSALEKIKLGDFKKGQDLLQQVVDNTQKNNQWYKLASEKLKELKQQSQLTTSFLKFSFN